MLLLVFQFRWGFFGRHCFSFESEWYACWCWCCWVVVACCCLWVVWCDWCYIWSLCKSFDMLAARLVCSALVVLVLSGNLLLVVHLRCDCMIGPRRTWLVVWVCWSWSILQVLLIRASLSWFDWVVVIDLEFVVHWIHSLFLFGILVRRCMLLLFLLWFLLLLVRCVSLLFLSLVVLFRLGNCGLLVLHNLLLCFLLLWGIVVAWIYLQMLRF